MSVTDSRARTSKLARPRGIETRPTAPTRSALNREDAAAPSLERFFPGCFEILLPAITTVIPQIFAAFRGENESRAAELALSDEAMDRSLAELMSLVGPLLSEVLPVLIEAIHEAGQQRFVVGELDADGEALERFLPDLLGALVPVLVGALPPALQGVGGLLGGLFDGGRDGGQAPLPNVVDKEVSSRFLGPLLQAFLPAVATTLPQLFALITGRGSLVSRDTGVSWQDFEETNRLWDNDNIKVRTEPIDDPGAVEIALLIPPHIKWWKGIQLQDDNGEFIAEAEVENDTKYAVVRVEANLLLDPGGYLVFRKATMFGLRTGMYRLATGGLTELRGRRATFYWYAA